MNTRTEQKAETRRHLVTRATRLFERRGFLRTTTAQVARAARLSHGSVFVHFSSREALIAEVVGQFGRSMTDRLHALATNGASVRDVLSGHLQCLVEHEALYHRVLVEQHLLPRDATIPWLGIQSAVSFHIAQAAEKEMADGRLRRVPTHLFFGTWVGLVHHYLLNRDLFTTEGSVLVEHGTVLLDHYLSLMAAKPKPKERMR